MSIFTLMYVKCRVFHGLFDFFHCNIQHREGLNYHLNKTHGLHGHFTYIEYAAAAASVTDSDFSSDTMFLFDLFRAGAAGIPPGSADGAAGVEVQAPIPETLCVCVCDNNNSAR